MSMDKKLLSRLTTNLTNNAASDKTCEEKQAEANEILKDIRVLARDVDNFIESKKIKKEIHDFENKIENLCEDNKM